MKRNAISLIIIAFLFVSPLAAEDNTPAWVNYEKGVEAMNRQDYGPALFFLKQAVSVARVMPEADLAIGDIYFTLNDFAVAELQYKKAWDNRVAFWVPDTQYQVLYRLARLYAAQRRYGEMYETLIGLSNLDTLFTDPAATADKKPKYVDKIANLYRNKGFDEMFILYRIREGFASEAHAQLARFYYQNWNFEFALSEALFGIIPLITEGMLEIRRDNPAYRYSTLEDFLKTAWQAESARTFLVDREVFRQLYYFALVSFELVPYNDSGEALLKVIAGFDAAGDFQRLARLQLQSPFREPRLDTRNIPNQ